ncbi:dual specificity protein phosphatase family protein [Ruegeria pomeroyi]|nr:dual specificity protein phosphatase family protein [Ruegeria pomeroyi]
MAQLVLYALQVGGGTLAICQLPGRSGDYSGDVDLIGSWAPGLVISMTTEVEMLQHGARNFGADIQSRACRWAHLPVDDFGVPGRDAEISWKAISKSARHALRGGGRVLIHCKGGCGRSGMAALRLMIETGEEPKAALAHLRSVRSCAVETDAQMDWALAGRAIRD